MNWLLKFAVILGALFLTACPGDKACQVSVNYFANVTNQTGRDLSIKVCRGAFFGPQNIVIPASQRGEMALFTNSESRIYTGGPKSACDSQSQPMGIALTSFSFQDVKLCRQEINGVWSYVFVERHISCPVSTIEQTAPVDECGAPGS